MKNLSMRTSILTAAAVALLGFAAGISANADPSFTIHVGSQSPPQPREDYHQWQKPDRSAVWIPGHHEWRDHQYVWVGGYYGYPPHKKSHWVSPTYPHNQSGYSYNPGHWSD